ncbi:accessory factor UbiK family protein [Alysiella crassa]|uniref:Ubiquinone biosynthesis accessory factor UbiK n=1 Tax=Alysiella crassa TaxID=153491 RepID=A0A376BVQ5_9NEIS|nr:accessory factor UbiK family protein [Alysiella crassa]UOP06559.1 accessory factor UbiK family protein [Alysiella crassa]SSY81092.1 Uncharacterized protein conserved in bacteria [Alysiella crassa]
MIAKQLFDEISNKLGETIANSPAKDIEKNAKAMLGSAFNKMDLVTREEFDVQQQVLIKTRTKLSEVEARLAALEAKLSENAEKSEDSTETSKPKRSKKTETSSEDKE